MIKTLKGKEYESGVAVYEGTTEERLKMDTTHLITGTKFIEINNKGVEYKFVAEDEKWYLQEKKGAKGEDGITPSIQVGEVTTLAPNQQATVTKRGSDENPIFDFALPKGEQGNRGEQGLKGDKGEQGLKGDKGETGLTPNIAIGTVTTLEPHQQATVTRKGTDENPVFDFGIPRGEKGVSGKKLIARYEHKANKVVQPSNIDLTNGIFTTTEPHGLSEGKSLWLTIHRNGNATNVPKEIFEANPNQWGRGRLKAHVLSDTTFQLYKNSGEYLVFTNEKNIDIDVSKFHFEYDLHNITINNINSASIDIICGGGITGGYFSVAVDNIEGNNDIQDFNSVRPFNSKQTSGYITYQGHLTKVNGFLNGTITVTTKAFRGDEYNNHKDMKMFMIGFCSETLEKNEIKKLEPISYEAYPFNGFVVEIWGE